MGFTTLVPPCWNFTTGNFTITTFPSFSESLRYQKKGIINKIIKYKCDDTFFSSTLGGRS